MMLVVFARRHAVQRVRLAIEFEHGPRAVAEKCESPHVLVERGAIQCGRKLRGHRQRATRMRPRNPLAKIGIEKDRIERVKLELRPFHGTCGLSTNGAKGCTFRTSR